ncbi:MAG: hypothetical protein ABI113_14960 [Mucilaginibacter sp.]
MSNRFYKYSGLALLAGLLCTAAQNCFAQASSAKVDVPDWALPGSATHKQVPPPPDFHRATVTTMKRIGIFDGQSEVGAALVPGSSSYNKTTKQYTINSAGYNIWYTRDEFRYLWKKMSGDVSLAADVSFPDPAGYGDRKALVIIRQNLDDDSKEAMVALHGAGLLHLAWRPEKGEEIQQMKVDTRALAGQKPDDKTIALAKRIGIEKHGDDFAIFVSMNGEPMHQYGNTIHLHIDGPFYVGIAFCSHQPATVDTGVLSDVVLENSAGKVR